MGLRYGVGLILVLVAGAAMAAIAEGQASPAMTNVPSNERTDPHVQPAFGSGQTVFTLTFILRDAPGHEGVMAIEYERRSRRRPAAQAPARQRSHRRLTAARPGRWNGSR